MRHHVVCPYLARANLQMISRILQVVGTAAKVHNNASTWHAVMLCHVLSCLSMYGRLLGFSLFGSSLAVNKIPAECCMYSNCLECVYTLMETEDNHSLRHEYDDILKFMCRRKRVVNTHVANTLFDIKES